MKIPFSPPYIDQTVIDEVTDSLVSGWITTGPKVKALEQEVAKFVNVPNVLCVNSWTSGAIMILDWLGLQEGDEVIIPAYTYTATALAVIHAGGKPVMVDSGDDFNIDVNRIKSAITKKTKAIIPVDFAGLPCDYNTINDLVKSEEVINLYKATSEVQNKLGRILVLSDAAHSLGAKYDGKMIGEVADITIFSFHAVKNVTTAEGGAICINLPDQFDNEEIYKELRLKTLNCQTKDAFTKSKAGGWKYDIVGLGMKINMADINAAVGLAQMRKYPSLLKERENIFLKYLRGFKQFDWSILPELTSVERKASSHIFPLRFNDITEDQRDAIIEELTLKGISVNVHFQPLPLLTYFKKLGYLIDDYPKAFMNYSTEISLPIYPQLTDNEVDFIIDNVILVYKIVTKNA